MLKVIGKENCNACKIAKTILTNKGLEFEYCLLDEVENKEMYIKMAEDQGKMSMPLIIDNNEIKTLNEVIKCI